MSAQDGELDDNDFAFESSEGRPANNRAEEYDNDERKPVVVAGLDLDDLGDFIPDNVDHTKPSPKIATSNGRKMAQDDFDVQYAKFVKAWKEQNPGYSPPKSPGHISLKAPAGYYDEFVSILDGMLNVPAYLAMSNAEIGERTLKKFPDYPPAARIMDRPIPTTGPVPIRMRALLRDSKHNGLSLKQCDTLSKLKKGIRGEVLAKDEVLRFTSEVVVTKMHVIVGGVARKISTDANGYRQVNYLKKKVALDTFLGLHGKSL